MSTVFDILLSEKTISSAAVPAFERYLTDLAFEQTVEGRMLAQDRISLATLAGPLPVDMNDRAMKNALYEMRYRFQSALKTLRDIDLGTPLTRETV